MILADFNAIAIASLFANGINEDDEIDEGMVRYVVLNTLRSYNVKFRNEYGQMVLAMDSGQVWRKKYYPQYKACRASSRSESKYDWNKIFDIIHIVEKEIRAFVPWKCVKISECEADDIIAILIQENPNQKNVIISNDKDFKQLQKFPNVRQWGTKTQAFIKEKDPKYFLFEQVIRGDKGDGVPNILSSDDCFTEGKRQTSIFQKQIDHWKENGFDNLTEEQQKNLKRNRQMVDLDEIPKDIKDKILEIWSHTEHAKGDKLMDYLIEKRCRSMVGKLPDFQPKEAESFSTLF